MVAPWCWSRWARSSSRAWAWSGFGAPFARVRMRGSNAACADTAADEFAGAECLEHGCGDALWGEAGIDDEEASTHKRGKADAHPPTFLPLEPFVVNLADKDVDRYAQVGIVLEIDEATFAEKMKAYMPAIRNAILMILANKTSRDLLDRVGKEKLADEIMREIVRPLGIDIEEPEAEAEKPAAATPAEGSSEKAGSRRKPARKPVAEHNPVRHVHFSSFIVQ